MPGVFVYLQDIVLNYERSTLQKELAKNYLDVNKMIWLIVGDVKTQLTLMKELGFGDPVLISK